MFFIKVLLMHRRPRKRTPASSKQRTFNLNKKIRLRSPLLDDCLSFQFFLSVMLVFLAQLTMAIQDFYHNQVIWCFLLSTILGCFPESRG